MKNIRKNSRSLILLSFVVTVLLSATAAQAQDKGDEIDKIFSWATAETPGCAVGVSQHGKVVVNRAYGLADLERDVPITPNKFFDIGSVQKQFIAAAILLLAKEGRLSLSDDVHKYIPELPDYGYTITLNHLLTHTSGIRDWIGIGMLSRGDEDVMTLILRQHGLNFAPGEEWSYSTSGYVLLKEIVARVSGMPFGEFANKRLFEPLGMTATSYREDMRSVIENRALAYEKEDGRWKLAMMHLGLDRGRGAIFSTASDLLIWNEALASGRLGAFVTEKLHEPARLNNGRKLGYARGLFLDSTNVGRIIWHSGSARAYDAMLARFPEHGLSIAVLCNAGDTAERSQPAHRIRRLFISAYNTSATPANAPVKVADTAGTPAADLSGKAGLFVNKATGQLLRLIVKDERLRIAGGPALIPISEDQFRNREGRLSFMSGAEFELTFLSEDQIELKTTEGEATLYHRVRTYALTQAELKAFAGRYKSEDMNSVFKITAGKDRLVITLNDSQEQRIEFRPINPDVFQRGRMTVHFLRNEAGEVIGLDYSNPVLHKVRYTRVSD